MGDRGLGGWTCDAWARVVRTAGAGLRRLADVAMMQATDFGTLHDPARPGELDGPDVRRVLVEREMSASLVIVPEVVGQDAAQVPFAEDENVVQTFAPDRTDEALGERILPWAVRCDDDFLDIHALHAAPKVLAVDLVTVAKEMARCGVVRESVDDLLSGPVGRRVLGDVEVDDPSAVMSEDDKNKEHAQACGGDGEEVEGDEVPHMVVEERPPRLRRAGAPPLWHKPRHGALGDVEAELQELAMDSGGAPKWVGSGHSGDQGPDLDIDGWPTSGGPSREFGPVLAEATPLPPQDGVRRHNDESLPPAGPDSGQRDPQHAINRVELRSGHRSLVHGKLPAEGEVLEGELTMAAEEEWKDPKQVEQEGDHRAGIVAGSVPADQPLTRRMGFWRKTAFKSLGNRKE
jgi:hypothetical protein